MGSYNKLFLTELVLKALLWKHTWQSSTFWSMYLYDIETEFTRPERNDDGSDPNALLLVLAQKAHPFGAHVMVELSREDIEVAY